MQEIIKIIKQIRKIKMEKGIKDYNSRKEPILINTFKIDIKGELELRITLPWEKVYSINYIEIGKRK